MSDWLRTAIKRVPGAKSAYSGFFNLMDRFWNSRSWISRTRTTPFGFPLTGGNSIHHRAMQDGTFEPEETAIIGERRVADYDVFVDVGANIGYFSCLARKAGKHVIAFEPQPSNLAHLYRNFAENGWNDGEVFPVGLSRAPGIATLYGASSTGASLIAGWAGASKATKTIIPLSTLDIAIGDRFPGKRLFVKIDTEGVEYDVLLGGLKLLDRQPRPIWMIEITAREFYPGGSNPHFTAIFEEFARRGYAARAIGAEDGVLSADDVRRLADGTNPAKIGFNFLFS